jgi:hypothetical protein
MNSGQSSRKVMLEEEENVRRSGKIKEVGQKPEKRLSALFTRDPGNHRPRQS